MKKPFLRLYIADSIPLNYHVRLEPADERSLPRNVVELLVVEQEPVRLGVFEQLDLGRQRSGQGILVALEVGEQLEGVRVRPADLSHTRVLIKLGFGPVEPVIGGRKMNQCNGTILEYT